MKELTTKLTAQQIFTLGKAARVMGYDTLEEFAAALLLMKAGEYEAAAATATK